MELPFEEGGHFGRKAALVQDWQQQQQPNKTSGSRGPNNSSCTAVVSLLPDSRGNAPYIRNERQRDTSVDQSKYITFLHDLEKEGGLASVI